MTARALRSYWRAAVVLMALGQVSAPAWGAPIHVTGQPVLRSLSVLPEEGRTFQVRGLILDDADTPLSAARVSLKDRPYGGCTPGSDRTEADGAFCLLVDGPRGSSAQLHVGATADHLPYSTKIELTPRRHRVSVELQLDGQQLDLEQEAQRIGALLSSPPGDEEQYALRLSIERSSARPGSPHELWSQTSVISSKRPALFAPRSDQLGGPGPLTLVAEARIGEESLGRTELKAIASGVVQLSGAQQLALDNNGQGQLEIRAISHGQDVGSGSVVATAPGFAPIEGDVSNGRAVLSVAVKPGTQSRVPYLRISYQSTEEQFRPGPSLQVALGSVPDSWRHRLPWMMLAGLAAFWVLRSWWRPALKKRNLSKQRSGQRESGDAAPQSDPNQLPRGSRWGVVVDVHTGEPLAGTRLLLRRPVLTDSGDGDLESESDSAGRFVFPPTAELPEGSQLLVWSPGFSPLQLAAPPEGPSTIAMTSIRRRLLERLVRWAKGMGVPWARPERPPTPAEVAAQARVEGRDEIVEWATAIESAAYAPSPPGPELEAALLTRTPPLDRPPRDKR